MFREIDLESALHKRLRRGIADRVTPGATVAAGTADGVQHVVHDGSFTYDRLSRPVSGDSLWDLASVTKVVVGASLVGLALDRGLLRLDSPVRLFHKAYAVPRWDSLVIDDLVGHVAGQTPWLPFYERSLDRDRVRCLLAKLPPEVPPRTDARYSDLDFLVLWDVLEAAFSAPLDEIARDLIFEPLHLANTVFRPDVLGSTDRCPPTEWCGWRGRLLQGEVHDENCAHLGGITPHAGLFSTVGDLARFMTQMVRALDGSSSWMTAETARILTTRRGPRASTFAVGWATPSDGYGHRGDAVEPPWRLAGSGSLLSDRSFGHTGFAGPSVVGDPERGWWVVVLANRVHPSRAGETMPALRRDVVDLVAQAVDQVR